ncbi:MAG: 50S ribosomal protein L16 [Euryarchaeota archaeon]|nr:50S ribosomal protein L16 [Euryarchaeota archaeon]
MSRKPGSMYREVKGQATTRREYMGGVPASRITQFDMGNKNTDFPIQLSLVAGENCQIRHNALESARISANRIMEKEAGLANYRLRICVFPHNVIRENKQATGAGADRVSMGMRKAFGKPVGTAARVHIHQTIATINTTQQFYPNAKNALRKAKMKVPTPCTVVVEKGAELLT